MDSLSSVDDELEWRKRFEVVDIGGFSIGCASDEEGDDKLVIHRFLERFGVDDFLSLALLILSVAATCGLARLGPPARALRICQSVSLAVLILRPDIQSSLLLFPFELVATGINVQPVFSWA